DDDLTLQPHYIEQNDTRYRAYMAANAWSAARMAVALVNAGADYEFYSNVQTIAEPDGPLALCNKNHQLPRSYIPRELRAVAGTKEKLRADAADGYERMAEAMLADLGLGLHIVSGYRGYQTQAGIYTRYAGRDGYAVADTYSARAGHSEHQTGLAIDITHQAPSGGLRRLRFEDTPQYAWLLRHAHEYGFILRYPDGWTPVTGYIYEPWHWRYIGPEHAARYHEGGYMTLEEYLGERTGERIA
ncbi:MAG: M15 family metallopeptidase, partial [Oscillospiraceae bacterium]|nr:M15 family metallopeptidase [Oscillospiraceae bacterium]